MFVFRKFGVLCFFITPVLRLARPFALLSTTWFLHSISAFQPITTNAPMIAEQINWMFLYDWNIGRKRVREEGSVIKDHRQVNDN